MCPSINKKRGHQPLTSGNTCSRWRQYELTKSRWARSKCPIFAFLSLTFSLSFLFKIQLGRHAPVPPVRYATVDQTWMYTSLDIALQIHPNIHVWFHRSWQNEIISFKRRRLLELLVELRDITISDFFTMCCLEW